MPLKVGRIAHAGILVKSTSTTCLMDPLFYNELPSQGIALFPRISINKKAIQKLKIDAVIISHEHQDHFCLKSLNLISRNAKIFYPQKAERVENFLRLIGFKKFETIQPRRRIVLNDLVLTATESYVNFPETGMVFESGGRTCWNLADSQINASTIHWVKRRFKTIDLLLAAYQPLIEDALMEDSLGASFPYAQYADYLQMIGKISPRFVVPTACGFRYTRASWLNSRGFPVAESNFLQDVKKILPAARAAGLEPGSEIEVSSRYKVKHRTLGFVRTAESRKAEYAWRPDQGITPLQDDNAFAFSKKFLEETIETFLDYKLLAALQTKETRTWLKSLKNAELAWTLEIRFPNGGIVQKHLDFASPTLRWSEPERYRSCSLLTIVTASAIVGILKGKLGYHGLAGELRRVKRYYQVPPQGLRRINEDLSDPLVMGLFKAAKDADYIRQLREIGFT